MVKFGLCRNSCNTGVREPFADTVVEPRRSPTFVIRECAIKGSLENAAQVHSIFSGEGHAHHYIYDRIENAHL